MIPFLKKFYTLFTILFMTVFLTSCGVVRESSQTQKSPLRPSSTPVLDSDVSSTSEGQDLASLVFGEDLSGSQDSEKTTPLTAEEDDSSPFTSPSNAAQSTSPLQTEKNDNYSIPSIITENLPDGVAFIQTGIASWYGPDFHGRNTANGEVYDMEAQTAAHKSLPFDTQVIVENQSNGKRIQLRINDRGPYAKDRVIDLSRAGAEAIDMIGPGTAPVKIYVLDDGSGNVFPTKPHYTVQLGSYDNRPAAEKKAAEIRSSYVAEVMVNGIRYYRVYFGDFENPAIAIEAMNRLKGLGHEGFIKQINK